MPQQPLYQLPRGLNVKERTRAVGQNVSLRMSLRNDLPQPRSEHSHYNNNLEVVRQRQTRDAWRV